MSRVARNISSEFWTKSDTNRPVQPQMIRSLRLRIKDVEGFYYIHVFSDNKGPDQLHLYFCLCKKKGFLMSRLKLSKYHAIKSMKFRPSSNLFLHNKTGVFRDINYFCFLIFAQTLIVYIRITGPCDLSTLTPHFYIVKLGFTRVCFFLIFALKHRLWVLVRTTSMRRF